MLGIHGGTSILHNQEKKCWSVDSSKAAMTSVSAYKTNKREIVGGWIEMDKRREKVRVAILIENNML